MDNKDGIIVGWLEPMFKISSHAKFSVDDWNDMISISYHTMLIQF